MCIIGHWWYGSLDVNNSANGAEGGAIYRSSLHLDRRSRRIKDMERLVSASWNSPFLSFHSPSFTNWPPLNALHTLHTRWAGEREGTQLCLAISLFFIITNIHALIESFRSHYSKGRATQTSIYSRAKASHHLSATVCGAARSRKLILVQPTSGIWCRWKDFRIGVFDLFVPNLFGSYKRFKSGYRLEMQSSDSLRGDALCRTEPTSAPINWRSKIPPPKLHSNTTRLRSVFGEVPLVNNS
jgi:hypothetical protein